MRDRALDVYREMGLRQNDTASQTLTTPAWTLSAGRVRDGDAYHSPQCTDHARAERRAQTPERAESPEPECRERESTPQPKNPALGGRICAWFGRPRWRAGTHGVAGATNDNTVPNSSAPTRPHRTREQRTAEAGAPARSSRHSTHARRRDHHAHMSALERPALPRTGAPLPPPTHWPGEYGSARRLLRGPPICMAITLRQPCRHRSRQSRPGSH